MSAAMRRVYLVLAALSLIAASALAAGPPDGLNVNVVNPPANPVPVTGSVTGTVTGTVGLTPGTTVGLTPGTSVMVDSTVADPVRVRNVNDAIQPVQASGVCNTSTIGCGPPPIYHVPAGKRLVIEYASMDFCSVPGQAAQLTITTTVGGTPVDHLVNTTALTAAPGTGSIGCNPSPASTSAVGQQVRLYADAGTFVFVGGDRTNAGGTGNANFSFSISGYLVDVPLTP